MIRLRGVSHSYDGRRLVLENIDLDVEKGDIVFIMGPNGSGKTTILKIMGLLLKPVKGRILFEGKDYWSLPVRERLKIRRRVIYVHENPLFFPGTVVENLLYPLYIRGYYREKALELISKMLRENGLIDVMDKRVDELSSGILQILSILRAMLPNPDLLLLDEPTEGLAPVVVKTLEEQIKKLKETGISILLAEQNIKTAMNLGDRVYIIEGGRIKYSGSMEDFKEKPEIRERYLTV